MTDVMPSISPGITVTLTLAEFHSAVQSGFLRFIVSKGRKMDAATTYARTWVEQLEEEVIGACGERAFCKAFGLHWDSSVDTFHDIPDAPKGVEIRATRRPTGCLVVRDNDSDERWYYLVTGDPPVMTIHGSLLGGAAKQEKWLRNPHGWRSAWFVPQSALIPPRGLP